MTRTLFITPLLMLALALPVSGQFLDPAEGGGIPGEPAQANPNFNPNFNQGWAGGAEGIPPDAAGFNGVPQGGYQDPGFFGQPSDNFGVGFDQGFGTGGQQDFFGSGVEDIMANRINVLKGRWISDAVTGQLLDVPEMTTDDEGNKQQYWNDGTHGGDVEADDEIWTNVETLDGQFIGAETQTYIRYYINMLRLLDDMNSLDFAGAPVASPDPNSPLPMLDIYETDQENWILNWNEQFLYSFRQPDPISGMVSPRGEFYPVYVPPPPLYGPARPQPELADPPTDFLQQAWVGFQGGAPDVNQITSVRNSAQGGQYGANPYGAGPYGAPGDQFGGSAANAETYAETGQSTYF